MHRRGTPSSPPASTIDMKFCTVVGLVTALVGGAVAQDTTVLAVPTGTPIPGDYNGAYRPQVHFSPPQVI